MITINQNVLDKALAKWGEWSQVEMCIEECSELILALQKRKRDDSEEKQANVIEELADVRITIESLIQLIGESEVQKVVDHKIDRLERRIDQDDETIM